MTELLSMPDGCFMVSMTMGFVSPIVSVPVLVLSVLSALPQLNRQQSIAGMKSFFMIRSLLPGCNLNATCNTNWYSYRQCGGDHRSRVAMRSHIGCQSPPSL